MQPTKQKHTKSEPIQQESTMLTVSVLWAAHAWNTEPNDAAKQVVADLYAHLSGGGSVQVHVAELDGTERTLESDGRTAIKNDTAARKGAFQCARQSLGYAERTSSAKRFAMCGYLARAEKVPAPLKARRSGKRWDSVQSTPIGSLLWRAGAREFVVVRAIRILPPRRFRFRGLRCKTQESVF